METKRTLLVLAMFCVIGITFQTVFAAPVIFQNSDAGVAPGGARPNSDAEAAAFDVAAGGLGVVSKIDFEDLPVGSFANLLVTPGVTVSLNGTDNGEPSNGISTNEDIILGYNTTAGGTKHLGVVPIMGIDTASATFDFDTPVEAFGAYLTGLGTANGNLHVLFNDGSSQDIGVSGFLDGGVQFFGFTSAGNSIVSVVMQLQDVTGSTRDIFGVDDVRFVSVPEPATMALLGLGGLILRKRKKQLGR